MKKLAKFAVLGVLALASAAVFASGASSRDGAALVFSAEERQRIVAHGPWPPLRRLDASNKVDGKPQAIELGQRLFGSKALSATGAMSCATCHNPQRGFQDGKRSERLGRNTTSVVDAAHRHWMGWDGATDSLWSASITPLTARYELAANPQTLTAALLRDASLSGPYAALFGAPMPDASVIVNVAKALAAYQATLVSPRTTFDDFRDSLAQQPSAPTPYPPAAQRGLKLFVGAGKCFLCHTGPGFTNGEFADIGRPFFAGAGVDPGRWGGLKRLMDSPYNRLGAFSDVGSDHASAIGTRHVVQEPRHFGEFKVPSLRGLAATAPYFHDGSAKSLPEVVRHYSSLDPRRLHTDGEAILKPLKLTRAQSSDLVAFLNSLSLPVAQSPIRAQAKR